MRLCGLVSSGFSSFQAVRARRRCGQAAVACGCGCGGGDGCDAAYAAAAAGGSGSLSGRAPVAVLVRFNPALPRRYRSRFRFEVRGGESAEVVLQGEGTLSEGRLKAGNLALRLRRQDGLPAGTDAFALAGRRVEERGDYRGPGLSAGMRLAAS